jgi:hypothetical protein
MKAPLFEISWNIELTVLTSRRNPPTCPVKATRTTHSVVPFFSACDDAAHVVSQMLHSQTRLHIPRPRDGRENSQVLLITRWFYPLASKDGFFGIVTRSRYRMAADDADPFGLRPGKAHPAWLLFAEPKKPFWCLACEAGINGESGLQP